MVYIYMLQFLRYFIAVESVCHPPLSIIFSTDSPCSNRSSAAPTLNEWPLSDCSSESIFRSFCSAFNMVLILAECRLFPICPCLLIDLRIKPSSLIILLHFSNKSNSSWLIGSIFPVPNWSVFEKLSRIASFPLAPLQMSSNLKAQSSDRRRIVS
jgi:hypothetical protein